MQGASTTDLLSDDGIEATTPHTLDDAELESSHELERWALLNILGLQTMLGLSVVSSPWGLPLSPRTCRQGGLLQVLSSDCFSGGDVEVALEYGDFLGGIEDLKSSG